MSVEFASRDLAAKYDRFARWYDSVEGILDFLGVGSSDEPYFRRHQVKSSKSLSEQEGTFTITAATVRSLPEISAAKC